jgi:hypothetical protein
MSTMGDVATAMAKHCARRPAHYGSDGPGHDRAGASAGRRAREGTGRRTGKCAQRQKRA